MNIFPSSASPYTIFFFFVLCLSMLQLLDAQQTYVNNKQLDCYNFRNDNLTNGYVCNGPQKSCTSYLTFRSQPPYYNSASQISYLLGADASAIARINNITDVETIPTNTQIVVPVNCSCSGRSGASYYQHNATYILKPRLETYLMVANDTYQGLSTCQALMNQNSYGDRNLTPGIQLLVPLRCACPSSTQSATGVKFLLAYLITWGDSISSIASTFNVDEQSIRSANELSSTDTIFPFTPVLVPLKAEPTKIQAATPPSPTPPPPPPIQQVPSGNSSRKWVFVGIGIGVGCLFLLAVFGFVYCFICGRGRGKTEKKSDSAEYGLVIPGKRSEGVSSAGVRVLVDSLTVYRFEELQKATGYFGDDHVIKGNVYRGVIRGDNAAIKKLGDISSTTLSEINILKQINHSSIIRLSGYCVHEEEGSTYLVYEFAENGSLYELLHNKKYGNNLVWNQRVQIAYDVADGLNYLHNYTNPPYIHKNFKSSNILLNGDFRAKMTNFGLARTMEDHPADEEDGGGGLHMTRHVVGTRGYMPPEYLENGVVTPKLDVFAFGVVMLELLSGKDAASASGLLLSSSIKQVLEGENVREKLKGFMDPSLEGRYPLDSTFSMATLAKDCVAEDLNYRPTMDQVFMCLSKILSSSLDWDPSDEVEFSRSFNSSR